ncbi:MAG: DUF1624 domain-containing protein [Lachnospiraceae bacterium]|nr:DUF1624 domain-containing protein [Lachnospiraceae bacterium]
MDTGYKPETTKNNDQRSNGGRLHLIDAFRGFTMISMVLYHSCYDWFEAFGHNPGWIFNRGAFIWQQSICISFIIISGMVWCMGRRHAVKRGLILLALGTAVTLVTVGFMPSQAIYYGILTFMGCATLLMIPLDKLFGYNQKSGKNTLVLTELIHILICLLLFAVSKHIPNGYIGTEYHRIFDLPDTIYRFRCLAILGLPDPAFSSADYFPVIPWIFMYLSGYHAGKMLPGLRAEFLKKRIPFLSKLGTKSLLVYIIHQPVCYAIVMLLNR